MNITAYAVQRDNRLAGFSLVEGQWQLTAETEREALWPTPRPGTAQVAASRAIGAAGLDVLPGGPEVPGAGSEPPMLIGPRLPHYAAWSPNGKHLCYVVSDGRSLLLKSWAFDSTSSTTHLAGAPLFPAWHPGSEWLAVHHSASLTLINVLGGEQLGVSAMATGFRTPAFSPAGLLAWAEVEDGRVVVKTAPTGGEARASGTFPGGVALSFRPGSEQLCAAVASAPEGGVFSELVMQSDRGWQRLLRGPLVAYWWAPTGDRFAALHPSYSGDGRFQVRFYDPQGHGLGAIEPFLPSGDVSTAVNFFDQYAVSHPLWSADGRWFGFAGQFISEGPSHSFTGLGGDSAWVWDTHSKAAPVRLSQGSLVTFGREPYPNK